ncbi:MAG TPA: ABC transporter ATP-binding protein [Anaerolineae bacterium]|nr:ABC transporter ATP-binding protein [Anaerolineae bacterium]HOQ98099.1 ABC transporter ATP-binding protein [Anaerolineae bacterium]HPL26810.1 ABC transporter ATP-binding protein [Anaerolineae bacterium]HPL26817.1 ABC transporter ATP-binding protein [Anaerolineae bacterium]
MIRTEGLTRHFDGRPAVEGLDLEIHEGEVFGFLGPNGAGKTTTMRMLTCLIAPTAGRAWVNGHPIDAEQDAVRASVGILTESPGLYDRLSAERNLDIFARLYGMPAARRAEQIKRYLQLLDLWEQRDRPVGGFSKGMRQKLALVRALLHEPPVLFLDEPTAALDPQAAKTVRDFVAELSREGRTVFLCTHNLDEAERLCDRIAVMRTRLIALDTPENLRRRLFGRSTVVRARNLTPEMAAAVCALPFVHGVEQGDGQLTVDLTDPDAQNPTLVSRLVGLGAEVQAVTELRHSLEDVYLSLMEEEKTA